MTEQSCHPEHEEGLALVCHPDFPGRAIRSIVVDARRSMRDQLHLCFALTGAVDDVAWPGVSSPMAPPDELWRHSCFEAFVGGVGAEGYCELNFNSAGQHAAYDFDRRRVGKRDVDVTAWVTWNAPVSYIKMHALLPDLRDIGDWRLGLSVIIEGKDGFKSYWALRHPPGPPDFHHPDCFAARLPAPPAP